MPDTLPEPYATIAQMRVEGEPEQAIADKLRMTRKKMWHDIARWNSKNPDAPVPRARSRPAIPFYRQVAALAAEGLTIAGVAAQLGLSEAQVAQHVRAAQNARLLPLSNTGTDYTTLRRKRAVPPRGSVSDILGALSTEEMQRLYAQIRTEDTTLATTIARVLKETLHDPRRG